VTVQAEAKAAIRAALAEVFDEAADFAAGLPPEAFAAAPEGKWSAGTQLAHLTMGMRPVRLAMNLPAFVPQLLFGRPKRPSNPAQWVIDTYREALARGGKAPDAYEPKPVPATRQQQTVAEYRREADRFLRAVDRQGEASLDTRQLPHPLIGKITLREMLCFCVYHTRHHIDSMRTVAEHR